MEYRQLIMTCTCPNKCSSQSRVLLGPALLSLQQHTTEWMSILKPVIQMIKSSLDVECLLFKPWLEFQCGWISYDLNTRLLRSIQTGIQNVQIKVGKSNAVQMAIIMVSYHIS